MLDDKTNPRATSVSRRAFLAAAPVVASHVTTPLPQPPPTQATAVQRLSWAGVVVRTADRTVYVDPWITPAIWNGAWTLPVAPVDVPDRPTTVLITHLHNDHFDPPAIRAALGETTGGVGCLRAMAPAVAARGFRPLPVDLFEPLTLGSRVTAIAVPAVDGVSVYDGQVSWIIQTGDRRIIHCGDTMYHGHFIRIGRAYGPFDMALLPINGAQVLSIEPRPGQPMSMTPEQAIAAAISLRARIVVPIHYGLHDPASYLEHPNAVTVCVDAAKARGVALDLVSPGAACAWRD